MRPDRRRRGLSQARTTMTRGDRAGGGVGGVCVGKSEVCHFAIIVSNLSRHQQWQDRLERQEGKHDTQAGSKQMAVAAAGSNKARMQRLKETAEAKQTHIHCTRVPVTINR